MAGCWVFAVKKDGEGCCLRDKVHWVGKGYTQRLGVDYNKTWAAVAHLKSVRMLCAVAVTQGLYVWQIDFEAAFLNSNTRKEIWMDQLKGYEVKGHKGEKCRLKKTIYGTMQGGHDWAETLGGTYDQLGYNTSRADPCIWVWKGDNGEYTLTATYTNDVLGVSTSPAEAERRKAEFAAIWAIKDVLSQERLLGMKILEEHNKGRISLSQCTYFVIVLKDYHLKNVSLHSTPLPVGLSLTNNMSPTTDSKCEAMEDKPYRPLLGAAMWGQLATRPDLSYAVSVLSRYQINPGLKHWKALLHVMGYIWKTIKFGL